ncbi:hypothetical protein Cni_G13197 [Canna indica]|uniref:Uncharacterized protein n=1 Tax=Canna indica TaxID=4628 RepID=A0AAQ3Q9N3_9LILI|nr:hypothetical protein Cni_G13197 [Canna indica]
MEDAPDHHRPAGSAQDKMSQATDLKLHDHLSWGGERKCGGAPALSRTCSTASQRFRPNGSSSTLRRTFSIRKSASVREGGTYSRIHGDNTTAVGDREDAGNAEEEDHDHGHENKGSNKKNKFTKACKKFFGF